MALLKASPASTTALICDARPSSCCADGESGSASIEFIFATVPALVSYSDTAGNSATVSYPVAEGGPGAGPNPFPIAAGTDGHIVLTFTLWRPQRTPIPSEAGEWIDIGGLAYAVPHIWVSGFDLLDQPGNLPGCPQSAYSTSDPNLTPITVAGGANLLDSASDQSANAANKITFTLDLTECLASRGFAVPNGDLQFHFWATTPPGSSFDAKTEQSAFFRVVE